MLSAITGLFGRSPFSPLQNHMEYVSRCIHMLPELFSAIASQDFELAENISKKISELEHLADIAKNDLRNHLPKAMVLAIDRSQILDILKFQDNLADVAEDIAVLATLKKLEIPTDFKDSFSCFLNKNIEAYDKVYDIIKEIHELIESSFGGIEAEKVEAMVTDVAHKEHEADLIQKNLLKKLFQDDTHMTYKTFHLWLRIFEQIASISNLSENLANRIRMTLELNGK